MNLEFVGNSAGEEEGLNHPGIETFMGAPYAAIARECGQNSRDARESDPVRISFRCIEVDSESIPGFVQLRSAINCCLREALIGHDRGDKPRKFLENARRVAMQPQVRILEVSDRNTSGLGGTATGSSTTVFNALVKATGVSAGKSEDSGGSFGIGKFAAYAPSELRTVFYSSNTRCGAQPISLFQGKTILSSHRDDQHNQRRATGYWGDPNFSPMLDPARFPSWARREQRGTSLFSIGFRAEGDWQAQLMASILQNFFLAIHRNELVFEVEGFDPLDRDGLRGAFNNPRIIRAAVQIGRREDLELASVLLSCMTDSAATETELALTCGGRVRLRMLVADGLPRTVAIIRNGMFISDHLAHFGEKFRRFPRCRDFIAVVEPIDVEAGRRFKAMENPSHDELTTERLADPAERSTLHASMVQLARELRLAIREKTSAPTQERNDIDELSDFFGAGTPLPDQGDSIDDPESQQVAGRRESRDPVRSPPAAGTAVTGTGGGNAPGRRTRNRGESSGSVGDPRTGSGGSRSLSGSGIEIADPRNHSLESGKQRRIFLTPLGSGDVQLDVSAPGMTDTIEPLELVTCQLGGRRLRVTDGRALMTVTAGQRISLDLEFSEDYAGPLSISLSAVSGSSTRET